MSVYTPLDAPTAPDAVKHAPLTDGQLAIYNAVHTHFAADAYAIPGIENGVLMEAEKFWLSNECLQRYVACLW